jgi:DNA/RNA-binding domain of Phe-tRNA-synthetase-like protein
VFKGKSIPSVAALVEAMFTAEIKNLLLTAGHDLDLVQLPLTLDVAHGDERYTLLRGQEQELKADDMFIRDEAGVISSIIYGPDQRTAINAQTRSVVFTVYAPDGVTEETVLNHLRDLQAHVLLIAPGAHTELLQVFGA